jgi:hypothetical protein
MTCRWTCGRSARLVAPSDAVPTGSDTATVYRELARMRRKDDFVWFARSQGVPAERLETLWQAALARVEPDRPTSMSVLRAHND